MKKLDPIYWNPLRKKKRITVKLLIKEENIQKKPGIYITKDIVKGHHFQSQLKETQNQLKPVQEFYAEVEFRHNIDIVNYAPYPN